MCYCIRRWSGLSDFAELALAFAIDHARAGVAGGNAGDVLAGGRHILADSQFGGAGGFGGLAVCFRALFGGTTLTMAGYFMQMVAQGWVAEGSGPDVVYGCAPPL